MEANTLKVLVQFRCNFADEFDVHGFEVMDADAWKIHQRFVENEVQFPKEKYFGSNQSVTFSNADGYFQCFKVDLLTSEEAFAFKKFFPYGFGKILYIED